MGKMSQMEVNLYVAFLRYFLFLEQQQQTIVKHRATNYQPPKRKWIAFPCLISDHI